MGRAEEELQTVGQLGVKESCIGVPGNECGGKLVDDMVGGVDHSCLMSNEQTGVKPAEGEEREDIRAGMGIVTDAVASQEAGIPKQTHDGEEDAVHEFTPEICSQEGEEKGI